MSTIRKVSRSEIDLPNNTIQDDEKSDSFELPDLEFDFMEVETTTAPVEPVEEEEDTEYEFPLFSLGGATTSDPGEDRGRTETVIQKISLREPSEERIEQSRPDSYYFATHDNRDEIILSAISGEEVIRQSLIPLPDSHPWRVMNLEEHNAKILELKKRKKQRPGKKKRAGIIESRLRKLEGLKLDKVIAQELKKKLMKKIHHKRGGKKNKKPAAKAPQKGKVTKPKYRTE